MPSHIQNSITSKASDPYMKPVTKTSFNCLCILRHPSTCKMHKLNLSMASLIKLIHDKFLWCVTQHMPPSCCVFLLPLRAHPLASQILLSTHHICASNCECHFVLCIFDVCASSSCLIILLHFATLVPYLKKLNANNKSQVTHEFT